MISFNIVVFAALQAALLKTASHYRTGISRSCLTSRSTLCLHALAVYLVSLLFRTGSPSAVYYWSRKNGMSSSSYCMAHLLKSAKNKKTHALHFRAWVSASREVGDYIAIPMPRVSDPIPGLEDWGYRLPNVSGVAARHWASRESL